MMDETLESRRRLDNARGYGDVWEMVKDQVRTSLKEHRPSLMLFLDDMPLRLGAYHPLGTNNIVLNRALIQIVEATTKSRRLLNAFVYTLLLHEYLHALGHIKEAKVRPLVYKISKIHFGEDHIATKLAEEGPWSLLRNLPIDVSKRPGRVLEIVKGFERAHGRYIA